MALADDLLLQAQALISADPRRPKQANLRRGVSSAYYALFHLLIAACVRQIAPSTPAGLAPRIARALTHSEMKEVCAAISRNNPGTILDALLPRGFSSEARRVANAFVRLQEERHRADYDLSASYSRLGSVELLKTARDAFADWNSIQNTEEATVFLYALAFARRWSK